jgi:hypothetical protein
MASQSHLDGAVTEHLGGSGGGTVDVVRMYTGQEGTTCFEDVALSLDPDGIGWTSGALPGAGFEFRIVRPGGPGGFHTAARRQFVVVLSGVMVIEGGGGETRRLLPGAVLFAEDTVGAGHRTDNEGTTRHILIVPVVPEFVLDEYRVGERSGRTPG